MSSNRVVFMMPQDDGDVLELYSDRAIDDIILMMRAHPVIGMVVNGDVEVHIGYAVFNDDGKPMFSIPLDDHPYTYATLVGLSENKWTITDE